MRAANLRGELLMTSKERLQNLLNGDPIYQTLDDHLRENFATVVNTALEYAAME